MRKTAVLASISCLFGTAAACIKLDEPYLGPEDVLELVNQLQEVLDDLYVAYSDMS